MPQLLSEDLSFWRSERPDEWIMDRFIQAAKAMEEKITSYNKQSAPCFSCAKWGGCWRGINAVSPKCFVSK